MARRSGGSLSRSLISAARAPSLRSPPPFPRLHQHPAAASRLRARRFSFALSRNLGELGCMQSFLPLYSGVATSHLTSHLNTNVLEGPFGSAQPSATIYRGSVRVG